MNIRSFDWRDLALLRGYLNRGIFLDSTRSLIHGKSVIPMGALLYFLGLSTRMFTYRCNQDSPSGSPLIGQISYTPGTSYAHFSFLAPEDAIDLPGLAALSDFMAMQMGKKGAFHILADVDESSQVFPLLHRAGFAIMPASESGAWMVSRGVTRNLFHGEPLCQGMRSGCVRCTAMWFPG
jgi:hypothetical protein